MGMHVPMRTVFFATMLLTACSSAGPRESDEDSLTAPGSSVDAEDHALIMAQIEQQVQLPANAHKLNKYARYYAADGTRVIATYIISGSDERLVGKRRWMADKRDLPMVMDGGCMVVNVVYDLAKKKVEQSSCNGVA